MNEIFNPARRAAIAAVMMAAVAAPAFAQDLAAAKAQVDAAKARGEVGEQGDGYLGFVRGPGDAGLQAAVAAINAGRADAYRDAASKSGVTPAAAGQAAAQQLLGRVPAGQYFKPIDGGWTRK
jgi:uncharacterized protein YdbL (DUF1318 family)